MFVLLLCSTLTKQMVVILDEPDLSLFLLY